MRFFFIFIIIFITLPVLSCKNVNKSTASDEKIAQKSVENSKKTKKNKIIKASEMVFEHNKVRKSLNIKSLKWSPKLALYAQSWADYLAKNNKCRMKHRPRSGKYKQRYGENIYWASAIKWSNGKVELAKKTSFNVVSAWASEVKDYNYHSNTCSRGKMCGHYTQLVWANTTKVGCGMAICKDKTQVWVCNYNPPGNYVGEKPY